MKEDQEGKWVRGLCVVITVIVFNVEEGEIIVDPLLSQLVFATWIVTLTLSTPALFSAKYKSFFFFFNLLLAQFLCWRDISRDLFIFREGFEFFFSYKQEKNEKSSQK